MEAGFDFISKQSLFGYRDYIPKTQLSIFQIGGYSAFVLPLDHLKFILGMGVYIKDRYDADNEIYHRVGMRYQFNNGLLVNLTLKTHWAKADYVEYGVGYTLKYKQKK
jgi:signal transduction histidine kinase